MKKSGLLILTLLLMVTGCGKKNQVICTGMVVDGGFNVKTEVIGYFDKNDKLYDVTVTYDYESEELSKTFCDLLKDLNSSKLDYVCKGSKVTINNFIEYNIDLDGDDITGMSKMEFDSSMEETLKGKISCKYED